MPEPLLKGILDMPDRDAEADLDPAGVENCISSREFLGKSDRQYTVRSATGRNMRACVGTQQTILEPEISNLVTA